MTRGSFRVESFHLPVSGGFRALAVTRPAGGVRGGVLHLPPMAEEMNRARRGTSRVAQALAREGWIVARIDHHGCGDSSGTLDQARWADWVDDVSVGLDWLRGEGVAAPVIWTLRAGSLVVSDWVGMAGQTPPVVACQPEYLGRSALSRFLRLHDAGKWLGTARDQSVDTPRARLDAGHVVEVSGYPLPPDVSRGLSRADFRFPSGYPGPVRVLEVGPDETRTPSPAGSRWIDAMRTRGVGASIRVVEGTSFWLTEEGDASPALVSAMLTAVEGVSGP